jgi:hypothetical protein
MSVHFHERTFLRPYVLLHDRTTLYCIISNMKMIVQFHIFRPKFSHKNSLFVHKLRTTIVKLNSVSQKQFLVSTSRVQSPESRVQSPESRVQSPESRVQSPESRVQSPESRVQSPEYTRTTHTSLHCNISHLNCPSHNDRGAVYLHTGI